MHPAIAQPPGLLLRFYAFSNRQHIQASGECQHGIQYRRRQRLGTNGIDKPTVNLQVINRKAFQIDEGAMAGAEIINGNFEPGSMYPFKDFRGFVLIEHIAFGDFQHHLKIVGG